MQALKIQAPHQAVFSDIPEPACAKNEVIIEILLAGICGTDLAIYRGTNPLVNYPVVPGHELAGVVVETGSDVPGSVKRGQQVTVSPVRSCGLCSACRQNRHNCCVQTSVLGVHTDGGFTRQIAMPWQNLYADERLGLPELAIVEPLTIGFHAVARGRIATKDSVAVFGCGAIGIGVICGAAARGAHVIAVDIDERKLALAKTCGAATTLDASDQDTVARLRALTDGEGPLVTVEAVGTPQTFRDAVSAVASGGRVVYIGWSKAPVEYETRHFIQKELDILGSRNSLPADYHEVIKQLGSGAIPVSEIVTTTAEFSSAPDILETWHQDPGAYTKIHLDMQR